MWKLTGRGLRILGDTLREFIALNAELSRKWPVINQIKPPPEDADEYKGVKDKRGLLET